MRKLSTYAFAIAACLATTALLGSSVHAARQPQSEEAQMATDGAFRDGLYLGRLTAEAGRPLRPAVGRWSSARDRASFLTGYQRGYGQVPAGALTAAE
jgi:hypothetical protein